MAKYWLLHKSFTSIHFIVTSFDIVHWFSNLGICSVLFFNTCLHLFIIFYFFSNGIPISSLFLEFICIRHRFWFHNSFSYFISINSPATSAVSWTNFLELVVAASSPVFVAVFNDIFPYCLDKFLENGKKPYSLTWLHRITCNFCLSIGSVKLNLFQFLTVYIFDP